MAAITICNNFGAPKIKSATVYTVSPSRVPSNKFWRDRNIQTIAPVYDSHKHIPKALIMKEKTMKTVTYFIFLGSKITAVGDCNHEIKRCLLLGRKAVTHLESILKSRDIALLTKVCLVKAMVFPVVMYGCESWTVRKAEHRRINAFELWCWRRLLRVPWTSRRSNQSILKEISPGIYLFLLLFPFLWEVGHRGSCCDLCRRVFCPGLISFRMDWLDLLEVQGTLKSLLQHHSSKASILWCSAFFTVYDKEGLNDVFLRAREKVIFL